MYQKISSPKTAVFAYFYASCAFSNFPHQCNFVSKSLYLWLSVLDAPYPSRETTRVSAETTKNSAKSQSSSLLLKHDISPDIHFFRSSS